MNANNARLIWLLRVPLLLTCFLGLVISAGPAYPGGVVNASSGGVAVQGYYPVAYFTMGKAVKGAKEFAYEWLAVTWQFTSAEHRDMFAADSIKYAPQHGGFCSVGVLKGGQYSTDPTAWRIVDGKLYLFFDEFTAAGWNPNNPAVVKADEDWRMTLTDLIQ